MIFFPALCLKPACVLCGLWLLSLSGLRAAFPLSHIVDSSHRWAFSETQPRAFLLPQIYLSPALRRPILSRSPFSCCCFCTEITFFFFLNPCLDIKWTASLFFMRFSAWNMSQIFLAWRRFCFLTTSDMERALKLVVARKPVAEPPGWGGLFWRLRCRPYCRIPRFHIPSPSSPLLGSPFSHL